MTGAAAGGAARSRRPWDADEDAHLRAVVGIRNAEQLARELGRTPTAIRLRAKRLGLRWYKPNPFRQDHPGHSARAVARMLGLGCSKAVARWIEAGVLRGERRAVREGPHRLWRVHGEDLERFLRTYRWLYWPERIADPLWRAYVRALPREEYSTTAEAAPLLFMASSHSVLLAIYRGDLFAVRRGNWLIPRSAILAYTPPPFAATPPELVARRRATLGAMGLRPRELLAPCGKRFKGRPVPLAGRSGLAAGG